MMSESIHDKYTNRPIGVEKLTLSQFATCYTKCKKKPKYVTLNDLDVSKIFFDHITNQFLPQHIKTSKNEFFRLRGQLKVLQIYSSSKKEAEEDYFAVAKEASKEQNTLSESLTPTL